MRWVPNLYELQQTGLGVSLGRLVWPAWVQHATSLSHLLTVLAASTSFYIYLAKHCRWNKSG